MNNIHKLSLALAATLFFTAFIFSKQNHNNLPVIAIANYGPHSSLNESIRGITEGLEKQGFKENHNIKFEILDVNFDSSLIMQMISKLKSSKPKIFIALTTPVAQAAKNSVKDIPIVFGDITDHVEAGLLQHAHKPEENITGASDKQDLGIVLDFIKKMLPNTKRIGILYATGESNDLALIKMMDIAAKKHGMEVVAVPIEEARDVPIRMTQFKGAVDAIYVGSSGPVQPSLPTIVAIAEEMRIPVFNMNAEEVKNHKVFASCGVSFYKVGTNISKIAAQILGGKRPQEIDPIEPKAEDHESFISAKRAAKFH